MDTSGVSDYVAFWVEGQILDRPLLDEILNELVPSVLESEPDTTHYEWSVSEDQTRLLIFERYADSTAAIAHMTGFARVADRFARAVRTDKFTILGSPSPHLRELLTPEDPEYATEIAGFSR